MITAPFLPIDVTDKDKRRISDAIRLLFKEVDPSTGIITAAATIANSTTETTVYTAQIAANELSVGRMIRTRIVGFYSTANGTDTLTARLKVGGTTVDSIVSTAASVTNAGLDIEFLFTVRTSGASGAVMAHTRALLNDESKTVADTSTTAINTTTANDVTLTIQWSAADAGNTATVSQGITQLLG